MIKNGSRCRYNVRFHDSEHKGLQESDFWKINSKPAESGTSDSSSDSSSDEDSVDMGGSEPMEVDLQDFVEEEEAGVDLDGNLLQEVDFQAIDLNPVEVAVEEVNREEVVQGGGQGGRGGGRRGGRGGRGGGRVGIVDHRGDDPPADPLCPHGQLWTPREKHAIAVDAGAAGNHFKSRISWSGMLDPSSRAGIKEPVLYFLRAFPPKALESIVFCTNRKIQQAKADYIAKHGSTKKRFFHVLNRNKFLRFLGVNLCMALHPMRGGYAAYWTKNEKDDQCCRVPGNYLERFKMSRQEFEDIRSNLTIHEYTEAQVAEVSAQLFYLLSNFF